MPTDTQAALAAINECEALLERARAGTWARDADGAPGDIGIYATQGHPVFDSGVAFNLDINDAEAIIATVNTFREHLPRIRDALELAERVAWLATCWERIADQHGVRQFTGNDHALFANELRALVPITDDASSGGGA